MPKVRYTVRRLRPEMLAIAEAATKICEEYAAQGYSLTLRQLYYQFVSRDLIPNNDAEYRRLGVVVSKARMAGLLDWAHIEDRTRGTHEHSHWDNPADLLDSAAAGFRVDRWATQAERPEVWVEKDALLGVIGRACDAEQVPYSSCRGYTSQSDLWRSAERVLRRFEGGQSTVIYHFGDHDPSGVDMSRDLVARFAVFLRRRVYQDGDVWRIAHANSRVILRLERVALRMEQVEEYGPPPNPAKLQDSRAKHYIARHGDQSWELDALRPEVLASLVRERVSAVRDPDRWAEALALEERGRERVRNLARREEDREAALADGTEEDADEDDDTR